MKATQLAALPQIEVLLNDPSVSQYHQVLSRPLVADIARDVITGIRRSVVDDGGEVPSLSEVVEMVCDSCENISGGKLQRVINATGVIIHTNMGRAPVSDAVWAEAREINCGYSNLELDLLDGKRGKRKGLIPALLRKLTGAEDALVVNNNAAAVYLILTAFASGSEVIVSRGEQVQIGGGFRVPEILRATGSTLVEVGTTNITKTSDYREAITDSTRMILCVHRSNFAIRGFEESPSVKELSKLKHEGILLCVDQGSGVIDENLPGEISVRQHLASGADLVSFSGDKIFSGPQAGIIAGRRELIEKLEKHPLMRVFRPGKTIYSLLELSLIRYLNGEETMVSKMLYQSMKVMKKRGEAVIRDLDPDSFSLIESTCTTGGGTAPDESFPSLSIRVKYQGSAQKLLKRLREAAVPVIAIIQDNTVHLNLATISDEDVPLLHDTLGMLKD